jgi:predicted signal transduction protein with EAL and GGDEF domain
MPAPRICVFTALTHVLNPANPGMGDLGADPAGRNSILKISGAGQCYFAQYQMWPAPIWLPAGIALYAALSIGRRSWPGIFVGALLTDSISFGQAPGPAAMLALADTIAPVVAAELIRNRISNQQPFGRAKEVVAFGLGALFDGMVAASVGATIGRIWSILRCGVRGRAGHFRPDGDWVRDPVLLLGGAAREQRAAKEALRKVDLDLEERVEQRTAELRESQHQLEKAAFYDPLNGLPNRRLLQERFGSCGMAARRKGDRFAVLVLDLDHFKNINDRLGHDAGDAVLVEGRGTWRWHLAEASPAGGVAQT